MTARQKGFIRRTPRRPVALSRAREYADQFAALIADACERFATAGDLRRLQPSISDLVFLAIPHKVAEHDLFGELRTTRDMLDEVVGRLVHQERLTILVAADGSTRRYLFRTASGKLMPLTLVWTTPERWGSDLAILTGPDGLAMALQARQGTVTFRGRAGMLPREYRYYDGLKTWEGGQDIPVPEEADFLRLFYGDDIPPPERRR
jgi:DNA polymerase/3'-5' exonuclease PolX